MSGVQSIAKHVKKEAQDRKKQSIAKIQKKQVIRKAKDILKKAEKARRESIGKMKPHVAIRMQGESSFVDTNRCQSLGWGGGGN